MKKYWKSIRYMDLCLLWKFEVPVTGVRILTADTILYIRVKKNGEPMQGRGASYCLGSDLTSGDNEVVGHFTSKTFYP